MTMIVVNIHEAKAKLSEYLESVASGQRVLICKRNQPVAELRAVSAGRTEPRPVGLAKGQVVVPESFFDPLPDEVIDAFNGGIGAGYRQPTPAVSRAADAPAAAYGPGGAGPRRSPRRRP